LSAFFFKVSENVEKGHLKIKIVTYLVRVQNTKVVVISKLLKDLKKKFTPKVERSQNHI
jgi:hypothetical protein